MNQVLSREQIEILFKFCEQHSVPYYDVQIELVDHLANAIEQEWKEDSHMDFHTALDRVYKRFGPLGFRKIIREKEIALERRHRIIYWQNLRSYFSLPKVLFSLGVPLFMLYFFTSQPDKIILGDSLITFVILALLISLLMPLYIHKAFPKPRKKLIMSMTRAPLFLGSAFVYVLLRVAFDFFEEPAFFYEKMDWRFMAIGIFAWLAILFNVVYYFTARKVHADSIKSFPNAYT